MTAPNSSPTDLLRRSIVSSSRATTGRLYLDGREVGSSDGTFLSPRQVGDQVAFLGRNWGHPSFNGRIQDRVSGALTAAEIAALAS